jgi:hypothetical protein
MTNLYIVTEHGEEGRSYEHGIFTDPEVAQGTADVIDLQRFSCVEVKTMKLDGLKFVPAKRGDEGYANSVRERE